LFRASLNSPDGSWERHSTDPPYRKDHIRRKEVPQRGVDRCEMLTIDADAVHPGMAPLIWPSQYVEPFVQSSQISNVLLRVSQQQAGRFSLLALLPLSAVAMAMLPAQAAPITCQAINATGLVSSTPPTIPGPVCTDAVSVGDTFEIDFSNVFASDPGSFSLSNFYSLQIANINTTAPGSQLSFADVELLITGDLQGIPITTPTAIRVWQGIGQQTGQGISAYSTNGTGLDVGFGLAFNSANFTLEAPQVPSSTFGRAAVINTLAFRLDSAGVTEFRSAKIRGKLLGATGATSQPALSAGLGIFSTSTPPTTQVPTIIYGNAFNTRVPGPLPLVGVGAAFGFSRRLRRRVKAASRSSDS
jgi:hypothetical protein